MPIYEFFCQDCNTIYSFYSTRINTEKRPDCPGCGQSGLPRLPSTFAVIGRAREEGDDPLAGLDEGRMEQAFESLMRESAGMSEDDPRQMANLMRKFSQKTGIGLGGQMEEALSRLEAGEDPEAVEKDMEGVFDENEPFSLDSMKKKIRRWPLPPRRDDKLHDL